MPVRILLIGAGGQLGRELFHVLRGAGEVVPTTRTGILEGSPQRYCEALDFEQLEALKEVVTRIAPSVVINAAAYNHVDRAEQESALAFRINSEAVNTLARTCATVGARLIHYSSDYVFSGEQARPWRESESPAPLNVYGATKLAGEEAIVRSGCRHMIFRIAWLYAAHSHNFLRTMLRLAHERTHVRVVDDQYGTPTPAHWVAEATAKVLSSDGLPDGIWHMAPAGETTWCGFAEAIFHHAIAAGVLTQAPRVVPVSSKEFATPARRPRYSVLDGNRAREELGIQMPAWEEGLRVVMDQYAEAGA